MKATTLFFIFCSLTVLATANAFAVSVDTLAASAKAEDTLYAQGQALSQYCMGCHGETGISTIESNPNLAGQNKKYLVYALKAYRDGKRKGGMASIMRPNASGLSDADIDALATYFSSQAGKQAQPLTSKEKQ